MGLTGQTKSYSNVNSQTEQLQKSLAQYLMGLGFGGANPGTSINEADIAPYRELFAQQNALNFAQAKESSGNLTGSGYGEIMGGAAARANSEQGAFLANLFEQRRQQDANRYMQLLLGTMGSPAGGRQLAYQPGFLDYAAGAAGAAAPFFFGGGGGGGGGTGFVAGSSGTTGSKKG